MLLQPDLRSSVCSIMLYLPECRETLLHSHQFLGSCQQTRMTYTIAVFTVKNS